MLAVLFDVEGVLIDVSERLRRCSEEVGIPATGKAPSDPSKRKMFWECFLSSKYLELDKPAECNIKRALELQRTFRLFLVTGAPRRIARHHARILARYGLSFDLFYRKEGDRRPAHVFKAEVARKLIDEGYVIHSVYDDDERVCQVMLRYAQRVFLVRGCDVRPFRAGLLKFLSS